MTFFDPFIPLRVSP